ncbi:beta-microseminoprotein-like [Salminus brasiliensis]|uniref:beta-microseminoprotein-like n=1 Tax=Salminus brasiliensis TaxID=930266 RepID=UPI003B8375A4
MSMLKSSVFLGFVLFALVPLSNAACWQEFLKKDATHCQDALDKTWHVVGSSWTNSKCDKCTCNNLMSCCNGLPSSVHYSEDCTVEYDYNACTYKVVQKSDRSIPCPHRAVGK